MGEENNRSSESPKEKVNDILKPPDEVEEEIREEKLDEQRQVSSNNNSDCTLDNALTGERGESRASHSETLAPVQLSEGDFHFDGSSHLLSEVPVEYSLQPLHSEEFKDQIRVIPEKPLKGITGQSSQLPIQHQIQVLDGSSSLEASPISVTKHISSNLGPSVPEQRLQLVINGNKTCIMEEEKHNFHSPKPLSAVPIMKTPSDGYNWRKYGQKQVKSPEGSRSYYRCTFSDCSAKKIDCCDRSHRVIETVYRSHHNHDPPQKLNCSRENRPALPTAPVGGNSDITHSHISRTNIMASTSVKEPLLQIERVPETKQQDSSSSDETTETNFKEEYIDGPECTKRQKTTSTTELGVHPKPANKPKFVVHAAGDMGISGDGYRWRKYGQKMVKGNQNPRNYYRCTSAGCPVRKHIEMAVDNSSALVITYKGVHDHDTPVPRKGHGPKSATSPTSTENSQNINKIEARQSQTQWSVDKEGELTSEALNQVVEKTPDSTRALVSIGFEIKPC